MMNVLKALLVVAAGLGFSLVGLGEEAGVAGEGVLLFRRACAMCHGAGGKADTPMARNLGVKDLTHSVLTDDEMRTKIREGARGPKGAMPAFGAKFNQAQLDALIAHLRSLRISENAANP